jgi:SM-20-related protein
MNELSETTAQEIATALARDGYIVFEEILDKNLVQSLYKRVISLEERELKEANIGRGSERQKNVSIRSDKTLWLDGHEESEKLYLDWMESLRQKMNQELYMGLYDYECHFAHYSQGSFYQKHLDVLRGNNKRLLTTVFYLTQGWEDADGGELLMYDEEGLNVIKTVPPRIGMMVIFLSDRFPHEVLPSHKDRFSIAGWFRSS